MTTHIDVDDLAQIIRQVDGNHDLGAGALAEAILDHLPTPHVIRTVAELDALDPDTMLMSTQYQGKNRTLTRNAGGFRKKYRDRLPAVVVAPAAQVRAARKALEEA